MINFKIQVQIPKNCNIHDKFMKVYLAVRSKSKYNTEKLNSCCNGSRKKRGRKRQKEVFI